MHQCKGEPPEPLAANSFSEYVGQWTSLSLGSTMKSTGTDFIVIAGEMEEAVVCPMTAMEYVRQWVWPKQGFGPGWYIEQYRYFRDALGPVSLLEDYEEFVQSIENIFYHFCQLFESDSCAQLHPEAVSMHDSLCSPTLHLNKVNATKFLDWVSTLLQRKRGVIWSNFHSGCHYCERHSIRGDKLLWALSYTHCITKATDYHYGYHRLSLLLALPVS